MYFFLVTLSMVGKIKNALSVCIISFFFFYLNGVNDTENNIAVSCSSSKLLCVLALVVECFTAELLSICGDCIIEDRLILVASIRTMKVSLD